MSRVISSSHLRAALLALLLALLATSAYLSMPSITQASGGEDFCKEAWLNRYGQSNDFCTATPWRYNFYVKVSSQEHSACVSTTTNSNKTGVNVSWVCTPGPYGYADRQVNWGVLTHGIIRNNTTGDTNHATGSETYCSTQACVEG